jgi:death-on-curing protein
MKTDWKWIDLEVVLAIHDQQIAEHGGTNGIRDIGLIESALARAKNLASHSASDVFDLAAEYGYGIARNHGFIDGNKRTAYVVTLLFLVLNGHDLTAPAVERVLVFEKLGKGELAPDEFAGWLRRHAKIFIGGIPPLP